MNDFTTGQDSDKHLFLFYLGNTGQSNTGKVSSKSQWLWYYSILSQSEEKILGLEGLWIPFGDFS